MSMLTGKGEKIWSGLVGLCLLVLGVWTLSFGGKSTSNLPGIHPKQVANYVHAVVEADRTIYTKHVVERMQQKGITRADEHWEQNNALPLPAQFLQKSGRLAAESGSGVRYGLMSLWPIRTGPSTEFERKALREVIKRPDRPSTGIVRSGKKRYFKAIYADRAVSKACVNCHNEHLLSPKRDFKLNDVMGGVVVTIPLGG